MWLIVLGDWYVAHSVGGLVCGSLCWGTGICLIVLGDRYVAHSVGGLVCGS